MNLEKCNLLYMRYMETLGGQVGLINTLCKPMNNAAIDIMGLHTYSYLSIFALTKFYFILS